MLKIPSLNRYPLSINKLNSDNLTCYHHLFIQMIWTFPFFFPPRMNPTTLGLGTSQRKYVQVQRLLLYRTHAFPT